MEISRNQIITVVLFLIIAWVYYTWDYKPNESFTTSEWSYLPPKQWQNEEYKKWGNQWYYANDNPLHPSMPSIVNYDNTHYKFPKNSLKILEEQYNKTQKLQKEGHLTPMPIAHNIHSGQTAQVAGTENINQVGAPLDEVLLQEHNLMQPIQEMKQRTQTYANTSPYPEMRASVKPELSHEAILQELQPEMTHKMRQEFSMEHTEELSEEGSLIHELTESRPEMRSEIMHEESIQKSLMPGMEQKHLLEERVSEERYERPIIIKVKKNDYNLSLAILLVVLLIGFIYQTRD